MKKSLAFTALLLSFVLLLSACGQKAEESETAVETIEETATEAFQGMTDADHAYLKTYLADYAEPLPGAKERVRNVLRVMLTAWLAVRIMQETEKMLKQLQ